MNTILSFMDKLYSDSKTLSMIYVIGAILLFIFVSMLMFSLRKTDKKDKTKIIEEPKIEEETVSKNEVIEEKKEDSIANQAKEEDFQEENKLSEQSIFEKTVIIPLDELEKKELQDDNVGDALNYLDNHKVEKVEEKTEESKVNLDNISSEIPDVDTFVDNVVKKTYEKNEQFSSVYVGNNTSTIKLDKVMEDLNVDEKVLESIVPEEEKTVKVQDEEIVQEEVVESKEDIKEEKQDEINNEKEEIPVENEEAKPDSSNSLDNLKKALEEKKQEVNLKQDELKAKLEGLKKEKTVSNETMKAEDLLNKLNSIKKD